MTATPEQVLRSSITSATETAALLRQLAEHARSLPYNLVIRWEAERMDRMAVTEATNAAVKAQELEDLLHPERAREALRVALGGGRVPSGELT